MKNDHLNDAEHHVPVSCIAPKLDFPSNKRAMAKREAFPVSSPEDGSPTILQWPADSVCGTASLRFTAAVDERVPHRVDVANVASGELYGTIDVLYAVPGEVFELELSAERVGGAVRDGLALQLREGPPLWLVGPGPNASPPVLPHLYAGQGATNLENFLSLFCSDASLQPFDWMGICVLDGLHDWARLGRKDAAKALEAHIKVFLDPDTGGREDIRSMPADHHAGGPESSGPFAVVARVAPEHPGLRFADEGFILHFNSELAAVGKDQIVAESNYNIAYPMMAMALHADRPELRGKALRQLEVARDLLSAPDDLYLRHIVDSGEKTFKNWSRGVAWYFLGLVRTLALLPQDERPESLLLEANRTAEWVTRHQLANGLWPCFLKEAAILPDSSGSAGIAAAIALGVRQGVLEPKYLPTASRAREGLLTFMTTDGWLRGTAQSNKKETHHMDIQRHPYRVIAPWGMGLFAQLTAALQT